MSDFNGNQDSGRQEEDLRREGAGQQPSGGSLSEGGSHQAGGIGREHRAGPTAGSGCYDGRSSQIYPPVSQAPRQEERRYSDNSHGERRDGQPPSTYVSPRRQGQSYQYNPGSGWQHYGSAGREQGQAGQYNQSRQYQWNYQEYDKLDRSRRQGGRGNRGPVVFTVCMVCVLVIGLLAVTGFSFLLGNRSIVDTPGESASQGSEPSLPAGDMGGADADEGDSLELASKPQVDNAPAVEGAMTIPQIAKAVSPSVVGVSAHMDSRFYEPVSVGSGIIMSSDGYIITNAHVVVEGTRYKVQLHDNTPYDAQLVGLDATTDLAVLKIDATGLTAAVFGDSNEVEVGETVVAIGNPSGLELAGSVTRGIVSAVNRKMTTDTYQFKYIQTDAAINPGNSGGALVNEFGQVIGINSSKIVATGYEGIGFAIPISDAKPILDDIIANGRVTGRPMLGVSIEPVTEGDSLRYGVPMGLEIRQINPGSDLIGKDVQLGDILVEVNDIRIYTLPDVQAILVDSSVGDTVKLKFYRKITAVEETYIEVTAKLVE